MAQAAKIYDMICNQPKHRLFAMFLEPCSSHAVMGHWADSSPHGSHGSHGSHDSNDSLEIITHFTTEIVTCI